MAIVQINYDTKSDINTTATPSQNKVSAADMNEIKSVVNTNATLLGDLTNLDTTDKTSVVNAVNEVITNSEPTTLWENTNPLSPFSSQPITLFSDDYNYLEIYYYDWTQSAKRDLKSTKVLKGYNISLDAIFQTTTETMMYIASRRITYTDETHLSVENVKGLNTQGLTVETVNEVCVPVKILGYK